jgi:hypothetical protein
VRNSFDQRQEPLQSVVPPDVDDHEAVGTQPVACADHFAPARRVPGMKLIHIDTVRDHRELRASDSIVLLHIAFHLPGHRNDPACLRFCETATFERDPERSGCACPRGFRSAHDTLERGIAARRENHVPDRGIRALRVHDVKTALPCQRDGRRPQAGQPEHSWPVRNRQPPASNVSAERRPYRAREHLDLMPAGHALRQLDDVATMTVVRGAARDEERDPHSQPLDRHRLAGLQVRIGVLHFPERLGRNRCG